MLFARASLRSIVGCAALCLLTACHATARTANAAEAGVAPCTEGIPELFKRVSPAVVMITGQSINPYRLQGRVTRVLGSGFLIDSNGLVLTNSHVVFGLQSLTVTLDDGSIVPAKVIGADPIFDLAVIQIPKTQTGTLPTVKLGNSDNLRPGEEVIAIGNPLGLDQTVTRGIVSGINRILPETPLSLTEPLIQTDTPINPGNSGGPLLNRCGEVIGINTAIVAEAQNIGFSVPINLAKEVLPALLKDGHVVRPWIGFHGQIIGADLRKLLQVPLVDGLLVEVVEPGSPAEKAGIRGGMMELSIGGSSLLLGGDIVVSLNGAPMDQPEKLSGIMRGLKVGGRLKVKVFREGKYLTMEYSLPERPLLPGDLPEAGTFLPAMPLEGKSDMSRRLHR
ncbi:MAG TPA: trypsin-like peptidase domain-containing protein [Burkholderiales bacterium]|nr:trypsin-like peptidase domain-containing protein [Burkholderiales bacterium]